MGTFDPIPTSLIEKQFIEFLYNRNDSLKPIDTLELKFDKVTRYKVAGDKGSETSGTYKVFTDKRPAAFIHNHRTGEHDKWAFDFEELKSDKNYNKLYELSKTPEFKAEAERVQKEREAKEAADKLRATNKAKAQWDGAQAATDEHPYLTRKHVKSYGLKVNSDGALLIDFYNVNREFKGTQKIFKNGFKPYAKDCEKTGAFRIMGGQPLKDGDTVLLCEGYATAATIHELIGDRYRVVMGIDCYNLYPVTKAIKSKFPNIIIGIAPDDDEGKHRDTDGKNPGIEHAIKCCEGGAGYYIPIPFSEEDKQAKLTDWNDYYCKYGADATRAALLTYLENPVLPAKLDVQNMEEDLKEQKTEGKKERSILDFYIPFGTPSKTKDNELIGSLFPRGYVSALFAPPGTGKTWFILRLATLLSQGQALSPKFPVTRPYNVMILSGEGGYDELIERAEATAWSYDARNFGVVDVNYLADEETQEADNEFSLILNQPDGQANFEKLIEAKRPDVIFLDSLMYYTDCDENKSREMNVLMKYLAKIARRKNIAIVPVHHARKRRLNELKAKQIMDEMIGSNMILRYVRCVIGLQPQGQMIVEEVTGEEPVIVRMLKFNRGKKFKPFTFQVETDPDTGKLDMFFNFEPDLTFKPKDKKSEILHYIQENYEYGDEFSRADLEAVFPGRTTLKNVLAELNKAKIIQTTGAGKNLKYYLREELID